MHLLIADDNALTLQFLLDAAGQLGHTASGAADGKAALALAREQHFDLILLDRQMPGLDGPATLRALRADAGARSRGAPAIATTADLSPELARALLAQGFTTSLAKPLDLATLERVLNGGSGAVRQVAEDRSDAYAVLPLLDDTEAVRRLGGLDTVRSLRRLFRTELEALPGELDACVAQADIAALRERLHRLRASAGFCGASRLDQACLALRRQIDAAASFTAEDLRELRGVADATLLALPD
jgi:CheY-like chemotaxis protein